MRRAVSFTFFPEGYEWVEPQPTVLSEGHAGGRGGPGGLHWWARLWAVGAGGVSRQEGSCRVVCLLLLQSCDCTSS